MNCNAPGFACWQYTQAGQHDLKCTCGHDESCHRKRGDKFEAMADALKNKKEPTK